MHALQSMPQPILIARIWTGKVVVHDYSIEGANGQQRICSSHKLGRLGRLDRVLRSAARRTGHIPKYASVSAYMRDVLHWLPVSQRILYRMSALVWWSVTGRAPSYLTDLQGRPSPSEAMMHFPPFQISPLFSNFFLDFLENLKISHLISDFPLFCLF